MRNTEKKISGKKSTSTILLFVLVLILVTSAGAATGFFQKWTRVPVASPNPVIFKNGGKVYTYDFSSGVKQINDARPEKLILDTSKFNTVPPSATKVKALGEADYCIFQLTSSNGESTTNFVRPDGSFYTFEMKQLILNSAILSADKTKILIRNAPGELYLVSLRKGEVNKYTMIDENVSEAYFTGQKNDIVYLKGRDFYYSSGGYRNIIEKNTMQMAVSTDDMAVYYIKNDLTLVRFYVGKTTAIDSNVYNMVYCGGGKLAYIKSDCATMKEGELFYTDGKEVIDTGEKAEEFLE